MPFAKETPQLMNSLEEKKTLEKLRTNRGLVFWSHSCGGKARRVAGLKAGYPRNLRGGSSKVEGNTDLLQAPQSGQ